MSKTVGVPQTSGRKECEVTGFIQDQPTEAEVSEAIAIATSTVGEPVSSRLTVLENNLLARVDKLIGRVHVQHMGLRLVEEILTRDLDKLLLDAETRKAVNAAVAPALVAIQAAYSEAKPSIGAQIILGLGFDLGHMEVGFEEMPAEATGGIR